MTVHEFIIESIEQIKGGINTFNGNNPHHHAYMPPDIEFELKVTKDNKLILASDTTTNFEMIKFKICVNTYPYDKNSIRFK